MGPGGKDSGEYDQTLEIKAGRMGGEYKVEANNDFYAGKVNLNRGDDYTWEYKRSSAVALLGSTLSMASVALYMAWSTMQLPLTIEN